MTENFDNTAKAFLLEILAVHKGPDNKISSRDLQLQLSAYLITEQLKIGFWDKNGQIVSNNFINERKMRDLLTWLRANNMEGGQWIVAHTSGGYFTARNLKELKKYLAPDMKAARSHYYRTGRQLKNAGLDISTQQMEL